MITFEVGETTASVSIPITEDTIAEVTENFSAVLTIPAAAASQGITKGAADTATIDILDNDVVGVIFNPTQYNVNEGDSVVTLTLNADKAASFEYTVEVLIQNDTATGNVEMLCCISMLHVSHFKKGISPIHAACKLLECMLVASRPNDWKFDTMLCMWTIR